jgi:hypothetical protein
MKDKKTLDRREFTVASAMAVLSGVAITLTACGGSSSSPTSPAAPTTPSNPTPGPTPTPSTDKIGTVGSNHGHSAVITAAQLTAGGALVLDITGTSSHPHTVELAQDEVAAIAANTRVTKESSTDASHSHTVTFN